MFSSLYRTQTNCVDRKEVALLQDQNCVFNLKVVFCVAVDLLFVWGIAARERRRSKKLPDPVHH